jgi:acetyltransferase-like isoleucine patch superfamily enzyme
MLLKKLYLCLNKRIKVGASTNIHWSSSFDTYGGGFIEIGEGCAVHKGVILATYGGGIKLGDYCSINPYSILYGHGGVTIGNGVRIAAQVCIISANHNFNSRNKYIYEQGITKKGIFIEDDVWVAAGVQILDGVNIKRGCVIAAGAVVTESTESYGIYGGVPAKLIKYREGK